MRKKILISFYKIIYRLYNLFYQKRSELRLENIKRLLLVSTTGIGDTLLSTPAIRAVRASYPNSVIVVLVDERRKEILEGNMNIDKIIGYRRGIIKFFPLIYRLRRMKPDAGIILHGNDPHILPIVFFSGAKMIIYHPELTRMPFFITHPVPFRRELHTIEKRLDLVRAIGADTEDKELEIHIPEPCFKKIDDFLKASGYSGGLLFGFQLGAAKPYKCWPVERFAEVGRYLVERYNAAIAIIGDSKDRYRVKKFEEIFRHKFIDASGKLTLSETAALISKLDMFLTNDTGPMHIAFALGTTTIALFCPTDYKTIGPYGKNESAFVISKDRPCDPCVTKKCKKPFCMDQISVEEVIELADKLIKKNHKVYLDI